MIIDVPNIDADAALQTSVAINLQEHKGGKKSSFVLPSGQLAHRVPLQFIDSSAFTKPVAQGMPPVDSVPPAKVNVLKAPTNKVWFVLVRTCVP